jgi:VWFA-related protein
VASVSIRRTSALHTAGALVALVATLVGVGHNTALADGPGSVTVASADDSAFPTITAVVLADQDGKPLSSLPPGSVTVTENGKPAEVVSVTPSSSTSVPLELVLAIDTSGSMAGGTLAQAQTAAIGLLRSLAPGDRAALISFDTQVRVEQPSTADLSTVIAAIGRLSARGNTALYDAVAKSADLTSQAQNARRAVVLLTDGEDYGGLSKLSREESLARSVASQTIFYTIGVGSEMDTAYLTQLAQGSGGRFFPAAQAAELPAIYAAIQERLRSYFVLTVRSTAEPAGTDRTIQVSIQSGASQSSGSLAYTSRRPAGVASTPEPSPVPVTLAPEVGPVSSPTATGGGSSWAPLLGGAGVALVPIGALVLLLAAHNRRAGLRLKPQTPVATASLATMLTQNQGSSRAAPPVVSLSVSQGGEVRRFPIAGTLRVGTAPDNEVRISDDGGVAPHHARIWVRDGRVMLHHLAPGFQTLMSAQPVEWASVEPGQDVVIGSATLRVATES